jgi:hypothetical protein
VARAAGMPPDTAGKDARRYRSALRPGMGHLPPIKAHIYAEVLVEQDQEMLDGVERA